MTDRATPAHDDNAERIIDAVCAVYELPRATVLSKSRGLRIYEARATIFTMVRKRLGWSYPEIGRYFGRDHSTIMHGEHQADEWQRRHKAYRDRVRRVRVTLSATPKPVAHWTTIEADPASWPPDTDDLVIVFDPMFGASALKGSTVRHSAKGDGNVIGKSWIRTPEGL